MKCQHCHEHEAANTFFVAFPGGRQEVHLCEACTKIARHYYELAKRAHSGVLPGQPGGAASSRQVGNIPFPESAGEDIRRRRRLNMLRARLEQAVQDEHYEEAARLRDQIAADGKDVRVR